MSLSKRDWTIAIITAVIMLYIYPPVMAYIYSLLAKGKGSKDKAQ